VTYVAPKAIIAHPGVQACEDAKANGFDDDRHDVVLRPGWHFKGLSWDGLRTEARFTTVAEFKAADPQQIT
jgi:hypothetical protein